MNIKYFVDKNKILNYLLIGDIKSEDVIDETINIHIPFIINGVKILTIGKEGCPLVLWDSTIKEDRLPFKKVKFIIDDGFITINSLVLEKYISKKLEFEVEIPESVMNIASYAFAFMNFSDFSFSDNNKVEIINSCTFKSCIFQKEFVVPKNCRVIGQYSFAESNFKEGINFSVSNAESIHSRAFSDCDFYETNIFLSKTVFNIASLAFEKTKNIIEFIVPEESHLETVDDGAFSQSELKKIVFYNKKNICFGANCFKKCKKLKVLDISRTLTKVIPSNFCSETTSLTSIFLPDTISTLGNFSFYKSGIKSFSAKNICVIGVNCFEDCSKLKECNFHDSKNISFIGYHAFNNTKNLSKISLPYFSSKFTLEAFEGVAVSVLNDIKINSPFFYLV